MATLGIDLGTMVQYSTGTGRQLWNVLKAICCPRGFIIANACKLLATPIATPIASPSPRFLQLFESTPLKNCPRPCDPKKQKRFKAYLPERKYSITLDTIQRTTHLQTTGKLEQLQPLRDSEVPKESFHLVVMAVPVYTTELWFNLKTHIAVALTTSIPAAAQCIPFVNATYVIRSA